MEFSTNRKNAMGNDRGGARLQKKRKTTQKLAKLAEQRKKEEASKGRK